MAVNSGGHQRQPEGEGLARPGRGAAGHVVPGEGVADPEPAELGGHHVQFNVVDAETLRRAQAAPGEHRNLIVRVAGYSDYFCDLSRELQDEILSYPESDAGRRCAELGSDINNAPPSPRPVIDVPESVGRVTPGSPVSSQETFGRLLVRLAGDEHTGPRLVTTSPDVSVRCSPTSSPSPTS